MMSHYSLNPKILREYDIRGVVDKEFGVHDAYLIGRGYGTTVKRAGGNSIVVGYDGRLTSVELEKALVQGLQSTGLHIIRVGLGPSPMTYFASFHLQTDAAIMITGSHNPASYNGFKMVLFKKSYFGEQIKTLGKLIEKEDFEPGIGTLKNYLIEEAYIDYLISDFETHYSTAKALKVVWDAGNGATGEIIKKLIQKLPGEHILLNADIDGTFPAHHPDPVVAENLLQLIEAVKEHKADLGFAFDGDGDRLGVIDNQGHIIWGDQLLILLSHEVLKEYPGSTIIADVKASQTLFDKIAEMGGVPLMWRTGHSLIKTKMAETKAPLAGEMSGHIFFADRHFGFDDALYAALRTLGIISTGEEKLSEWYQRLPHPLNTPEIRLECSDYDKFSVISQVQAALKKAQTPFIDIDGVRVVSSHGWWLLRASNTTEELVARVEANSVESLEILKEELRYHLEKFSIPVPD
jgi:phosphomannomutase